MVLPVELELVENMAVEVVLLEEWRPFATPLEETLCSKPLGMNQCTHRYRSLDMMMSVLLLLNMSGVELELELVLDIKVEEEDRVLGCK